jgi:hypothetical protein
MHVHQHIEQINHLLVETIQHITLLEHTMHAHRQVGMERAHDIPGTVYHPEPYTLEEERAWWQRAHQGLVTARLAFQEIDKAARQRADHLCERPAA